MNNKLVHADAIARKLKTTIKNQPFVPVDTGYLKDHAFHYRTHGKNEAVFYIENGGKLKYVDYLEYGTAPHDIPNAFGYGEDFGVGGRFDGKFHPGSTKHIGWISGEGQDTFFFNPNKCYSVLDFVLEKCCRWTMPFGYEYEIRSK